MAKVGFIGVGKLGLPVAVCMADRLGHDVLAYDFNWGRCNHDPKKEKEAGFAAGEEDGKDFNDYLAKSSIKFSQTPKEVAQHAAGGFIFVAVQTPHHPDYDGTKPLPESKRDFDYTFLIGALDGLCELIREETTIVIISTVLPGTLTRDIMPRCNRYMNLAYNPSFVAMGTVMQDFMNPEFILIGSPHDDSSHEVWNEIYRDHFECDKVVFGSLETAEVVKVTYNTFISMKLAFVNVVGHLCHEFPGADVKSVTKTLRSADRRLISGAYMESGMGDGGACHPRDNIAMSWLCQKQDLHFDIFHATMEARQQHAVWLAQLVYEQCEKNQLLPAILGYAFKAETGMADGSHALLVAHYLREAGYDVDMQDSSVTGVPELNIGPAVYFIGCKHRRYRTFEFPIDSVVIDPWCYIPGIDGRQFEVIRVGENQ